MKYAPEDRIRNTGDLEPGTTRDLFRANRAWNWIELCERRASRRLVYVAVTGFLMGFVFGFAVAFYDVLRVGHIE